MAEILQDQQAIRGGLRRHTALGRRIVERSDRSALLPGAGHGCDPSHPPSGRRSSRRPVRRPIAVTRCIHRWRAVHQRLPSRAGSQRVISALSPCLLNVRVDRRTPLWRGRDGRCVEYESEHLRNVVDTVRQVKVDAMSQIQSVPYDPTLGRGSVETLEWLKAPLFLDLRAAAEADWRPCTGQPPCSQ
jgi:hypothetical protein